MPESAEPRASKIGDRTIDPREFAAQYVTLYPRLQSIATAVVGDGAVAEDIVQDAVMIAVRRLDQFEPGTSLAAWLSEIVRRCALGWRRDRKKRRTYAADPGDFATRAAPQGSADKNWPVSADTGRLVDDQVAFDDKVQRALLTLSETARCCLLLQAVQKLSYAEISELLGIPEGTAMSHVHRAKAAMRRALERVAVDRAKVDMIHE